MRITDGVEWKTSWPKVAWLSVVLSSVIGCETERLGPDSWQSPNYTITVGAKDNKTPGLPCPPGGNMANPLSQLVSTSGYGPRFATNWHSGIDFRAAIGTPVVAADGGEVVWADWGRSSGGQIVEVKNLFSGRLTTYAHLHQILVNVGDIVIAGVSVIGLSGNTDGSNILRTTSPHLHMEVTHNGYRFDPMTCLSYGETVEVREAGVAYTEFVLDVGETLTLTGVVLAGTGQEELPGCNPNGTNPPGATACRSIYWTSSDPTILTVGNKNGTLTGLKPGIVQVEVSASLNTKAIITVRVGGAPPGPFTGAWNGSYTFGPMSAVLLQTDGTVTGTITDAANCIWSVSGSAAATNLSLPSWQLVSGGSPCPGSTVTMSGSLDAGGTVFTGSGVTTIPSLGVFNWNVTLTKVGT